MADVPVSAAPAAQVPSSDAPVNNNTAPLEGQAPVAPKVEAPKRFKSLKLKVDGNEFDEELPFEMDDTPQNREYMTKQLQMARMGQNRAKQTVDLQNKIDAIGNYLQQAKGDPRKIRNLIKELGADEKQIAAAIIEEEIANSQKSPEQLAHEKLQEELRQLKEERDNEKKEWTRKEFERLQGQEFERYDVLMSQALEKSDLPKSPYTVKKMADYMLMALENGVELTPDEIIPMLQDEIKSDIQQMFGAMPEEAIEKLIGGETLKKIRQKNIKRAKEAGKPPVPVKASLKDIGAVKSTDKKPEVKKTIKQLFGI